MDVKFLTTDPTFNTKVTHVGVTSPGSPYEGMLWLDTSTSPPVLKVYKEGSWLAISTALDISTLIALSMFFGE